MLQRWSHVIPMYAYPADRGRPRAFRSRDLYALIPTHVRFGRRFLITTNDDGVVLSKTTTVSWFPPWNFATRR
jgi:hypothetical protein